MSTDYYYLLMSQQDFFKNQVLEEVIRERISSYFMQKKKIDFWITISPSFINNKKILNKIKETNFYNQKKELLKSPTWIKNYKEKEELEFSAILISSNKEFITWIALRLGYFEKINLLDEKENKLTKNYVSDGIEGKINLTMLETENFLETNNLKIHPDFQIEKYKKLVNFLY